MEELKLEVRIYFKGLLVSKDNVYGGKKFWTYNFLINDFRKGLLMI